MGVVRQSWTGNGQQTWCHRLVQHTVTCGRSHTHQRHLTLRLVLLAVGQSQMFCSRRVLHWTECVCVCVTTMVLFVVVVSMFGHPCIYIYITCALCVAKPGEVWEPVLQRLILHDDYTGESRMDKTCCIFSVIETRERMVHLILLVCSRLGLCVSESALYNEPATVSQVVWPVEYNTCSSHLSSEWVEWQRRNCVV